MQTRSMNTCEGRKNKRSFGQKLEGLSIPEIDESTLTGESVPVSKQTEPLDAEIALAERTDMAFKGTSVTSGSGKGLVTATGMSTELGGVASLVEEAEEEETPLEKRLERLGYRLIWVTLGIALVLILSGNVAEIMVVAAALLLGLPLPTLPLQILYLNLIGDVFPALALGVGAGHSVRMNEAVRDPREPILTNRHWGIIGGYGACWPAAYWLPSGSPFRNSG